MGDQQQFLHQLELVVTVDLSVPGHPHTFAAGDAAALPDLASEGLDVP